MSERDIDEVRPHSIHPDLLMTLLYGSPGGRRFTQDTPVLPEVWMSCAEAPDRLVEGLIVPHRKHQAHHVAAELYQRLKQFRARASSPHSSRIFGVSDLPGLVTVSCYFDEVVNVILPLTQWWRKGGMHHLVAMGQEEVIAAAREAFGDLQSQFWTGHNLDTSTTHLAGHFQSALPADQAREVSESTVRLLIALGLLTAAQGGFIKSAKAEDVDDKGRLTQMHRTLPEEFASGLRKALQFEYLKARDEPRSDHYISAVKEAEARAKPTTTATKAGSGERRQTYDFSLIFTVSHNRVGNTAVADSVPTTKADAARRLFKLADKRITWAVIDSGVDAEHHAFRDYNEEELDNIDGALEDLGPVPRSKSRVVARYRMAVVYRLRNRDELFDADGFDLLLHDILGYIDLPANGSDDARRSKVEALLTQAKSDLEQGRPLDWELAERLLRVRHDDTPTSHHGTHVAGTLGGRWPQRRRGEAQWIEGMCPEIKLMDFDVIGPDIRITEHAVVAAMRLIRHLNADGRVVHGANLSLSIPHDVTNYACGRTPVCAEAETLVNNGVVVVAAAGNQGYNVFRTADGDVPLHSETSITDPGNAEAVITVGATHRREPHTYGISYFSSRGPTGDGRIKPDLVAPGEKITAPICGGEFATLEGTSMAAPHVSGAAALLMARFPELKGQPRRIKEILCSTATDLGRIRAYQGCGLVDVLRALQSV